MASATVRTVDRDGSTTTSSATIGQYIIERLGSLGVEHVFGIPGDYVLGLYKLLEESPISLVGMTREDNAGFRGRRVRSDPRPGVCLRDVLRRRTVDLQQHRRCLRREIAGDRSVAARRGCRSGRITRCCITR